MEGNIMKIINWLLLLALIASLIGVYFISRKSLDYYQQWKICEYTIDHMEGGGK